MLKDFVESCEAANTASGDGARSYISTTNAIRAKVLTMIEAGIQDFAFTSWMGLFAPAGTPAHAIERLNLQATRTLARPEVRAALANAMMESAGGTNRIRDHDQPGDHEVGRPIVKETGVRLHN
jgi:tripartite-type tricarboxylate transporter receptor subunit TctC